MLRYCIATLCILASIVIGTSGHSSSTEDASSEFTKLYLNRCTSLKHTYQEMFNKLAAENNISIYNYGPNQSFLLSPDDKIVSNSLGVWGIYGVVNSQCTPYERVYLLGGYPLYYSLYLQHTALSISFVNLDLYKQWQGGTVSTNEVITRSLSGKLFYTQIQLEKLGDYGVIFSTTMPRVQNGRYYIFVWERGNEGGLGAFNDISLPGCIADNFMVEVVGDQRHITSNSNQNQHGLSGYSAPKQNMAFSGKSTTTSGEAFLWQIGITAFSIAVLFSLMRHRGPNDAI